MWLNLHLGAQQGTLHVVWPQGVMTSQWAHKLRSRGPSVHSVSPQSLLSSNTKPIPVLLCDVEQ